MKINKNKKNKNRVILNISKILTFHYDENRFCCKDGGDEKCVERTTWSLFDAAKAVRG